MSSILYYYRKMQKKIIRDIYEIIFEKRFEITLTKLDSIIYTLQCSIYILIIHHLKTILFHIIVVF